MSGLVKNSLGHLLTIGSPGGKEHSSGDTGCGPRSQAREAAWDTAPQSLRNQDSSASSLDDGKEQMEWRETQLQGSEQSSPPSLPRPALFTSSHFPKHFCRTIGFDHLWEDCQKAFLPIWPIRKLKHRELRCLSEAMQQDRGRAGLKPPAPAPTAQPRLALLWQQQALFISLGIYAQHVWSRALGD